MYMNMKHYMMHVHEHVYKCRCRYMYMIKQANLVVGIHTGYNIQFTPLPLKIPLHPTPQTPPSPPIRRYCSYTCHSVHMHMYMFER